METIINVLGCLALLAGLLFVGAAFCSMFGSGNIRVLEPPKSPRPAPPKGQRPGGGYQPEGPGLDAGNPPGYE